MIPIERITSGIPGFDKLCEGGFVKNSVTVVIGGPGSGKTTFLLQYLWEGIKKGENGLFVSFEPDLSDLIQDAYAFGWDFSKYDQEGTCKFVRFSPATSGREIERQLTQLIAKHNVKRVCFDPITVFAMTLEKEAIVRENIYSMAALLKRLKVNVLLSEEVHGEASLDVSSGYRLSRHGVIEFLVDSVVTLHGIGLGGETDRALRIVKMRRTNHKRGPVAMTINGKGIIVKPGR